MALIAHYKMEESRTFNETKTGSWYIGVTNQSYSFEFSGVPLSLHDEIYLKIQQNDLEAQIDIDINGILVVDGVSGTDATTEWNEWKVPAAVLNETTNNVRIYHNGGAADWGYIYDVVLYSKNSYSEDSSGNGNHLIDTTSSTIEIGKLGNALRKANGGFTTPLTNFYGDDSISMWYKHNGSSWSSEAMFGTRAGSDGFMLYRNPGDTAGYYRAYFWYVNTSGVVSMYKAYPGISGLTPDTWYHIAMTRNSYGEFNLYKDGVAIYEGTPASDFSHWHNNGIKLSFHGSNASAAYTGGDLTLDDVRIYDHALSLKEVKELAKAKVLHYTFDDFQEPTINYLSDGVNGYNAFNASHWHGFSMSTVGTSEHNTPIFQYTTAGTSYIYTHDYILEDNLTELKGKIVCFSLYIRRLEGNATGRIRIYDNVSGYSYQTYSATKDFQRVSMTKTIGSSSTPTRMFVMIDNSGGGTYEFYSTQLEQKDHATPFTISSRPGSITDISGQDNHAELTEATTPTWTNDSRIGSGAYEWNGTASNCLTMPSTITSSLTNCSVSFWRKKTTAGGWLFLQGQPGGGHYIMATSNGTGNFYHNTAGTAWTIYVDGIVRANPIDDNNWHHYVITNINLSAWTMLRLNDYPSWYFRGVLDDLRIYATALSANDVKKLYNTRAQVDNKGNFFANNINETGHKPLLMDYTAWVNGTSNSTAGNMGTHGSQNRIVIGSDPWGKEIPLWESYGIDNTTTNSGIYGYYNSIDNTKLYRMSWWEKRISNGNATYGRYYAGLNGSPSGVWNLSSDTYNTNPYFWSTSRTGLPIGEWFLVVGHVWPHTYTGGVNHQDSGRWGLDGNKIGNIGDFRSGQETTTLRSRTLSIYQGNDGGLLHHTAYPRMDLCDGSEPTIDELLSGFDSNYIEYVREKGGTAGISLNVGDKDTYLGEINEIGMPVRYIRETMVGSSANAGNHWVEIQAYNSNGINVALGKTAVSSILTDGNTASSPYYSTGPATVDLGNVYIVDYLKIWHYYADARRYYDIKTEVSTDNINWTTVFDSNIDGEYIETSAGKEIPLKPKSFRIGKSNVYVNEINETL